MCIGRSIYREQLGKRFEEKGFQVQLNYQPERTGDDDPGEVDLICVRDGLVLVMEIKSIFLRRLQKDDWLHSVTTLRKSGLQPRRKVQAVQNALTTNSDLASMLCIETEVMPLHILGWIVDTSIEHDHERFNGFLKVSLEELLIALRDDRHLLNDPDGFSSSRFVAVIESEAVWEESVH